MRWIALAPVLLLIGLSTGCTPLSGYRLQFRDAQSWCVPPETMVGAWEGYWESEVSGHRGALKAVINQRTDGSYEADFHARFFKLFTAQYSLPLHAWNEEGVVHFRGTSDLGMIKSRPYTAVGWANECQLIANYCTEGDHGRFVLCRVRDCGCCTPPPVTCAHCCER